jgi:WD40 repeat protein
MTTSVSPPAYAQTKLFLMAIGVLAGGTLAQIAPQSCTFESGTCGWTESGANAWTRGTSTPSADTGAKKAQQGKYFMYLETSNGSPGDASYLVSTGLSVAQQQSSRSMVFYYHMYGTSMGILSVETQVHGRWSTLWSKRGQQHRVDGASWTKARAVLPKGTTRVRFKGTKGHSYTGDMCIDTVLLREPSRSCVVSARDNPSFRDKAGDVCIGWVGYNCFNSADYSVAALKNIRQNCPRSCSTCSCARPDSSSFRDSQGDGCADWVGYSCVEQPKYSDSELRQVRQHCPKACGFCGQQQPHKLINSGNSGCTAKQKCALCHGDCDSDVECQAGLHCFQRNGQSQIPGCTMIAKANIAGYDFCYSQTSPPAPPPPASSGTAQHQGNSFDINQLNLIKSLGNAHTKGTLAYARSLDFSPDHKILASCSQNEIKIWSVAGLKDMKLLTTLTKTSDFEEVVFIDDHLMASASSDSSGGISLWRMNGGNTAHWIDVVGQGQQVSLSGGFFESAAYDSTLRVLALGDIGGKIELWAMPDHVSRFDYRRLKLASRLPYAHSNSHWPTSLAFSPNHQILASASKGEIKVWTVKSSGLGSLVTTLSRNDEFTDVAFISSSIMISVSDGGGSSSNGGVSLWKINRGRLQYWKDIKGSGQLRSFTTGFFESVAYDPTSNLLAIGDIGGKIEMWSGARAVTKYVGWQKEAFVFCRSSDTIASQYTTRRQAENACKENPRCLAISDTSCDDRGRWVTCKSAKGAKSAMNSCMYIKGHVSTGRVEYNVASTNAKCDSKLTEISECIAAAKALGIKAKLNQEATTVCAKNVPDPSCSTKPHGCIYQAQVGILQFNKAPSLVPCGASSQACICSSARHWQINKNHYCSTKDTIRSGYKTEAAAQSACKYCLFMLFVCYAITAGRTTSLCLLYV